MKILYVYNFKYPDYQSDTIYHGLIDSGLDVYESHYPHYMMDGFKFNKQTIYDDISSYIYDGMPNTMFTLYGKLKYTPKVESPNIIIDKIKSKFYDIVIYGCVYTQEWMPQRQCLDYLDEVKKYYSKEEVHFIDGSDNPWNFAHSEGLSPYGTIWKSQLESIGAANPISFGIPESQLIKENPKKEKLFADIIPGNKNTYIYNDEVSYYNDYAISHYGVTWKKGQWNCLRHLEILANKCIPYFPDIEDCPSFIMMDFPKEIIKETNKYARRNEIHPQYEWINDYLFDYTKNNLTTKKIVEKMLNIISDKIKLKKKTLKIEEFTICLHCGCSKEVADNQINILKPLEEKYKIHWNNRIDRHPEKYESYSKLINHSVATSSTEWIILINDRTVPTVKEVEKMINLLENGFACVLLYNVGFMGFSKELIRKIGWWDERFLHAGWEDRDWVWRIRMNNLALYESQESTYDRSWKTSLTNSSYDATSHWYNKYNQENPSVIYKMIPEENYENWNKYIGNSVPEISNSWKTWDHSQLDIMYNYDLNNPLERSASSMLKGRTIEEVYQ